MSDEAAIRQVVETWMDATRRGDLPAILSLMTDDVLFMVPGAEPFGKDAFAASFKGMTDVEIDGKSDIVEIRILGEWAFTRNHIDLRITQPGGKVAQRAGYTLTLFRKEADGQWRLARDANLLSPVG